MDKGCISSGISQDLRLGLGEIQASFVQIPKDHPISAGIWVTEAIVVQLLSHT